ncbi:hypothetical protein SLEP1_g38593 [Rubroshorea leprosula]|uniref:DUF4283 domain-containing protein n=1 Tax=Rubroshorea leprosula TaxID=152421 RepID=A0AAV5KXV7_9ROSI|nr:hypothetical protein SLEP1_g38593 [Rubroshorea leprosula]
MPSRSRMVWLRFAGVPLKAWSERCFTELGALLGEVILVDEDTKSKSFLSEVFSDSNVRGRMEDGSGLVVGQGTMKSSKLGTRSVQARRAQNTISGVLGEGGWIEKPELVKMEAVRYFSELFQKDQWNRPLMGGFS